MLFKEGTMFDCFSDLIQRLFGIHCRRWGTVVCGFGHHEVTVKTHCKPRKVFLSIKEPCGCIPVCGANVTVAGTKPLPNGFVLYVDVASDAATIE